MEEFCAEVGGVETVIELVKQTQKMVLTCDFAELKIPSEGMLYSILLHLYNAGLEAKIDEGVRAKLSLQAVHTVYQQNKFTIPTDVPEKVLVLNSVTKTVKTEWDPADKASFEIVINQLGDAPGLLAHSDTAKRCLTQPPRVSNAPCEQSMHYNRHSVTILARTGPEWDEPTMSLPPIEHPEDVPVNAGAMLLDVFNAGLDDTPQMSTEVGEADAVWGVLELGVVKDAPQDMEKYDEVWYCPKKSLRFSLRKFKKVKTRKFDQCTEDYFKAWWSALVSSGEAFGKLLCDE
eukprot:TRINITY_DN26626_c0_g1_i1.p1 TRINITY_DN26626_c0_g1~~TRINITY_DN26626_c0_g1_i1.p1  ORF type:complete len:324 (+),score=95.32 TRINITY_DN26626_c0_g1_i1:104-973(+)